MPIYSPILQVDREFLFGGSFPGRAGRKRWVGLGMPAFPDRRSYLPTLSPIPGGLPSGASGEAGLGVGACAIREKTTLPRPLGGEGRHFLPPATRKRWCPYPHGDAILFYYHGRIPITVLWNTTKQNFLRCVPDGGMGMACTYPV